MHKESALINKLNKQTTVQFNNYTRLYRPNIRARNWSLQWWSQPRDNPSILPL